MLYGLVNLSSMSLGLPCTNRHIQFHWKQIASRAHQKLLGAVTEYEQIVQNLCSACEYAILPTLIDVSPIASRLGLPKLWPFDIIQAVCKDACCSLASCTD